MDTNRYSSIKNALEALERGVTTPDTQEVALPPTAELRRRIEALAALPDQVERLKQGQGEMLTLLRDLVATVERLQQKQEEVNTNPPFEDTRATLGELEEQRRMNTYLKGELERRDSEAEVVKRPWWKFWRQK